MSQPLLGVYGLSYSYGKRSALSEISFEVEAGEFLSLLGPNGSGKSTLLRALAGVLPLSAEGGQVRLAGEEFLSLPARLRARKIAYVSSDLRAEFPLTAWEAVWMGLICRKAGGLGGAGEADREVVEKAMERCLCLKLRDRLLHTLSGGERQLVGLARALVQAPRIILADEALSRMDLNHQAETGRVLREFASENRAVILVSHDLNIATEWADSALLLRDGKSLARGPLKEVLTDQRVRELYPHSSLKVASSPVSGTPKIFFGAPQR